MGHLVEKQMRPITWNLPLIVTREAVKPGGKNQPLDAGWISQNIPRLSVSYQNFLSLSFFKLDIKIIIEHFVISLR